MILHLPAVPSKTLHFLPFSDKKTEKKTASFQDLFHSIHYISRTPVISTPYLEEKEVKITKTNEWEEVLKNNNNKD